jgi:hypothetical protein
VEADGSVMEYDGKKRKSPSRLRRDALRWQVWKSRRAVDSAGIEAHTDVDVRTGYSVDIGAKNVVVCKFDVGVQTEVDVCLSDSEVQMDDVSARDFGTQTDVIVADVVVDVVDESLVVGSCGAGENIVDATVDDVDVDTVDVVDVQSELTDVAKLWARAGTSAEIVRRIDAVTRRNMDNIHSVCVRGINLSVDDATGLPVGYGDIVGDDEWALHFDAVGDIIAAGLL